MAEHVMIAVRYLAVEKPGRQSVGINASYTTSHQQLLLTPTVPCR